MPTADDWRKFNQSLIEEIRVIERKVSGWSSLFLLITMVAPSGKRKYDIGWSQTELTTMYYRSPKL